MLGIGAQLTPFYFHQNLISIGGFSEFGMGIEYSDHRMVWFDFAEVVILDEKPRPRKGFEVQD